MRLHRTLPQGSSLEFTAFFMNRSLASRMLMLGLPLLALVLLIIFTATGSSIEAILDRAIARNAQLQSQAMSLALEQALEETRNQLLILAAGSMDQKDMANRLKFRAKAGGLRYRELAFEGLGQAFDGDADGLPHERKGVFYDGAFLAPVVRVFRWCQKCRNWLHPPEVAKGHIRLALH